MNNQSHLLDLRKILLFALLLLACMAGLLGLGMLYASQVYNAFLPIMPSCTVGITGTAASIEVRGLRAAEVCQKVANDASGTLYQITETPTAPEVCEGNISGVFPLHAVVRDQGVFDIYGKALCQQLLSGQFRMGG